MPLADNITSSTVSRRSWCTLGGYPSSVWRDLPSGLCSSGRAYPTTVCRVTRGRLIDLLDRHGSVLIEGKLRGARISAAALHLCDDELIGSLRSQSIARTARLPARRYYSPGGRSEPLRLITCEQFDPCSGLSLLIVVPVMLVVQGNVTAWRSENGLFFFLAHDLSQVIGSPCIIVYMLSMYSGYITWFPFAIYIYILHIIYIYIVYGIFGW